ncbi:hypothetical protein RB195_023541 [Necator americanus]|uniref:Uncharacterized protein n=1 Tax=Necator americanus TaxID=51031 RepID=A0ABR1EK59_NECAM
MWVSARESVGIGVNGQTDEHVDEYLSCMLKNYSGSKRDIQQTKCLWSTLVANEVKLLIYLSAVRLIMMYRSVTCAASATMVEKWVDCEM